MRIRAGLGQVPTTRERREEFLTLHEVSELLRRGALAHGLIPFAEHFSSEKAKKGRLRLDWMWMRGNQTLPVAAFELEGVNAHERGLRADARKFEALRKDVPDALRILVLFHLDKNYEPKGKAPGGHDPKQWARMHVGKVVTGVLYDYELMAEGRIEGICAKAVRVADRRRH